MIRAAALRDRVLAPLAAGLAVYGGLVLFVITAITMVNVAGFTLDALAEPFGGRVSGLSGYEEVVALLIGGATLAFLPWCQLRRGHVVVDLFTRRLPARAVDAIDRLALALTAVLALGLAVSMAWGMARMRADGVVTGVLSWPEWPFWSPGVVALALWGSVAAVMAVAPPAPADDPAGPPPHG
ncbi:TRAP transporter small permease [Roseospira navarrensis]|uniref:TRAP transporter small permease protein n=1 Tax=Roseospira navarrensis TaxID=140058 RepID=A0A7X2D4Z2_9PROT|nr:TRAP transporter small permease subunit [Roseospira navarrensis]MQX38438.1 TRAP transporter small permease subunit [Roseospira navarrensis]